MRHVVLAFIVTLLGCRDGSWEDRTYVGPVISEDGSLFGVTITRWREKQLSDPVSDALTEKCCHTYELRVVAENGSSSQVVMEPEEATEITQVFAREGYAVLSGQSHRQLWLADGSLDLDLDVRRAGAVIGSPSGARLAVVEADEYPCEAGCVNRLKVLDAHSHEVVFEHALPADWPTGYDRRGRRSLRWLDEETLLVHVFLIRLDGTWEELGAAPDCRQSPQTTSSHVTSDGQQVLGRLEGDDVVFDFTEPGSIPPWPGPCVSLLDR